MVRVLSPHRPSLYIANGVIIDTQMGYLTMKKISLEAILYLSLRSHPRSPPLPLSTGISGAPQIALHFVLSFVFSPSSRNDAISSNLSMPNAITSKRCVDVLTEMYLHSPSYSVFILCILCSLCRKFVQLCISRSLQLSCYF